MDTTSQNEVHALTGLFPGDYFIHEFDLDGQSFFAYGLLRSIDGTKYHADYKCRQSTVTAIDGIQTVTPSCRSHQQACISVGTFAAMAQFADSGFSVN
jgi:hypothetical protein